MNSGFQHQRPFAWTAAVRSAPSPQHGAHLDIKAPQALASSKAPIAREEKSFDPRVER